MFAIVWRALTARLAGPVATAAALALLLLCVSQCSGKQAETRRADRAEDSLKTERENLQTCRRNVGALDAAVKRQNAQVDAAGRESAQRLQAAERELADALKGKADVERRVAALTKRPAGADACARMESADRNVLEHLR